MREDRRTIMHTHEMCNEVNKQEKEPVSMKYCNLELRNNMWTKQTTELYPIFRNCWDLWE